MRILRPVNLFCLCCLFFLPSTVLSDSLNCKVVSVLDGETITVITPENQPTKIRLYGIDTPEKGQAHGQKAKRFTFSLMYGKEIEVIPYTTDNNGYTVGVVLVDGMNANEEIIRSGHGWQLRNKCTASFCSRWLELEQDAKVSGVGLWHDNNPVPPWEWRKEQQESIPASSSGSS